MRVTPSDRTIALATPAPTRSGALSPEAVTASSSKSAATATPVKTLTELLAENPHKSPDELRRSSKYLPRPSWASRLWVRFVTDGGSGIERKRGLRSEAEIEDERRRVRACGNWGEMEPSDLFLDVSSESEGMGARGPEDDQDSSAVDERRHAARGLVLPSVAPSLSLLSRPHVPYGSFTSDIPSPSLRSTARSCRRSTTTRGQASSPHRSWVRQGPSRLQSSRCGCLSGWFSGVILVVADHRLRQSIPDDIPHPSYFCSAPACLNSLQDPGYNGSLCLDHPTRPARGPPVSLLRRESSFALPRPGRHCTFVLDPLTALTPCSPRFTNYWQPSDSQKTICNALRDLSKRLGEEGKGKKVVVKLVYDRGTIKQVRGCLSGAKHVQLSLTRP